MSTTSRWRNWTFLPVWKEACRWRLLSEEDLVTVVSMMMKRDQCKFNLQGTSWNHFIASAELCGSQACNRKGRLKNTLEETHSCTWLRLAIIANRGFQMKKVRKIVMVSCWQELLPHTGNIMNAFINNTGGQGKGSTFSSMLFSALGWKEERLLALTPEKALLGGT